MTFAQYAVQSVANARVLVQLDIAIPNEQWVNNGAGLWAVNTDNLYSWVDSSLLDGFTAQNFAAIGSVHVDGVLQQDATSMALLVPLTETFWYDDAGTLWVHLINHDEPSLHDIWIGVIYGYSFDEFTPVGAEQVYEGRLLGTPIISKRRDPLYFGKLVFGGGTITLANGDGDLDSWAADNNIYGNPVRIYLGYDGLDISEYQRLYTGYIGRVAVSETDLSIQVQDKRKQLTAPITYACTALNALDAIVAILTTNYNIVYNATYFDTTAWDAAQASVETVTLNMQSPAPTIDVIQGICASVFGVFYVTSDDRFSFRRIDTTVTSATAIADADIRNQHRLTYDPTEVISSARIGYARDWATNGTQYTYVTNTTYEASVFNTYKTYNERTFDTYLHAVTAATAYGETLMVYAKDVHGTFELDLPMAYYVREIGETVDVPIRRATTAMIATAKSEIIDVRYDLSGPSMALGLRIV
mgnify:CR=1 FL=1